MYILIETQEDFAQLNSTAKKCIASLCECISPDRTQAKIPAGTNVFQNAEAKQKLYVLRDGVLEYRRGERMLLYFDEGDLVGLEQHFQAGTVEVCSDFAVTVDEYDVNRLFTQIASDPSLFETWNRYLATQFSLFGSLLACLIKDDKNTVPKMCSFKQGEMIIEEGTPSKEVYTLVEGHAEAMVQDVVVGEILRDEIFGAIGALTDTPRTATVRAQADCTVLVLPAECFDELVKARPQTVQKLVEDMSRRIVALNKQVVGAKK